MDSGVGGLAVLKKLVKRCKNADFYYLSDSENAPYGSKDRGYLLARTAQLISKYGKKANGVIFACNTLSTNCLKEMKNIFAKDFFGVRPKAAENKTLVLCTEATKKSELLSSPEMQGCDLCAPKGLVEFIEKNICDILDGKTLNADSFLPPDKDYDTVELSCTHYIFLRSLIEKIYNKSLIYDGSDRLLDEIFEKLWEKWGIDIYNKKSFFHNKIVFLGVDKHKNRKLFAKILKNKAI